MIFKIWITLLLNLVTAIASTDLTLEEIVAVVDRNQNIRSFTNLGDSLQTAYKALKHTIGQQERSLSDDSIEPYVNNVVWLAKTVAWNGLSPGGEGIIDVCTNLINQIDTALANLTTFSSGERNFNRQKSYLLASKARLLTKKLRKGIELKGTPLPTTAVAWNTEDTLNSRLTAYLLYNDATKLHGSKSNYAYMAELIVRYDLCFRRGDGSDFSLEKAESLLELFDSPKKREDIGFIAEQIQKKKRERTTTAKPKEGRGDYARDRHVLTLVKDLRKEVKRKRPAVLAAAAAGGAGDESDSSKEEGEISTEEEGEVSFKRQVRRKRELEQSNVRRKESLVTTTAFASTLHKVAVAKKDDDESHPEMLMPDVRTSTSVEKDFLLKKHLSQGNTLSDDEGEEEDGDADHSAAGPSAPPQFLDDESGNESDGEEGVRGKDSSSDSESDDNDEEDDDDTAMETSGDAAKSSTRFRYEKTQERKMLKAWKESGYNDKMTAAEGSALLHQIAENLKISYPEYLRFLYKRGIRPHVKGMAKWQTDKIRELYQEPGITRKKIATLIRSTEIAVNHWIDENLDIPTRPKAPRLTEVKKKRINELLAVKTAHAKIMREVGCTQHQISRLVAKNEDVRRYRKPTKRLDAKQREKILSLLGKGYGPADITRKVDCTKNQVKSIIRSLKRQ